MNTIDNNQASINLYSQNYQMYSPTTTDAEANTENVKKEHHHHKSISQSQDSVDISQYGLQALSTDTSSSNTQSGILDSLVSDGTISPDQKTAIQSAFQAARQQLSGTYGTKHVNPLDNLVSSGTITKNQENAIKDAFKASRPSNQPETNSVADITDNTLDSLVSSGLITQDQANTIENSLTSAFEADNKSDS